MGVALRMSGTYVPTLKEDPSEAEVASHRLLLRAGMMRKTAAGIYSFLPLGLRALAKVERVVREEMDRIGSQEILMPAAQPAELWLESGRWDLYGPELMRFKDRHGRDFCLGPTHEELVTSIVRDEVRSYRDLPLSLYQIQVKFRDEVRPRFGLLRGREFIMKDAYSFHSDQASLQEHYDAMSGAYARICERLALDFRPVEAESGQIGGKVTTEFMALAESGEASLVHCAACGYAANVEAASTVVPRSPAVVDARVIERVATPGIGTIAELSAFLDIAAHDTVKTMAGLAGDSLVFFCIPGDRELNPVKAERAVPGVRLLDEDDFRELGLPKGSLGPVGIEEGTLVVAQESLREEVSWGVGANEDGFHFVHAAPGRDFEVAVWADLVLAEAGDLCPRCGAVLSGARGIEVSQVFQLGTRYSQAMGATFADEDGVERPFLMGCYGVGISRSLAAVIEQHNDGSGIVWPISVAPLEVAVVPLAIDDGPVWTCAERVWRELADAGVETLIDDRDLRPGVKFADADLIGLPFQIVVGSKGLARGIVEVKERRGGERVEVPIEEAVAHVSGLVDAARAALR
ncbi:MAG: proline--tRNA ligase [Coriobacteriia bacterium]